MAGTISSTTKFTTVDIVTLTPAQKEQFAQWLSFSRMNGVDAIPDVGYNDYQEGYTPHVNMRYVNQGEVLGISLTLQMESNNEDADMMELRRFYGLDETLRVVWNSRERPPEPTIGVKPASTAITGKDPGDRLSFGQNLYQMHGNFQEGTILEIPNEGRYIAVRPNGPFAIAWRKV